MGYICKDCGNTETFAQEVTGSCSYWEKQEVDSEGGRQDTLDGPDYDDHEYYETSDLRCAVCDSDNIGDDEDEEVMAEIGRPTTEAGTADWKTRFQNR